jgi:hypothetical protein
MGLSWVGAWPAHTFPPHLLTEQSIGRVAQGFPLALHGMCPALGLPPAKGAQRLFVVPMCLCLKPDGRQQSKPWHPDPHLEQT